MANAHDYASVLNVLIERVKQIGEAGNGDDVSLACYQILESAISEAEVWGVNLDEIGLDGYKTDALLVQHKTAA